MATEVSDTEGPRVAALIPEQPSSIDRPQLVDRLELIDRSAPSDRSPLAERPQVIERPDLLGTRHVLVVGINYAPEPTGIAPYTTRTAEHLATRAHDVEVLAGVPHYPNWQVSPRYRRRRRTTEPRPGPDHPLVRRLWHYVPGRQSALTRAGYELTFLAHAVATRPVQRPDLVVAVTPALGGAVAAARLARRHGAQLVVVVQDLMAAAAGQSGISGGSAVAGTTARLERYALRRADRVVVVSESFRPAVRAYGVPDERIVVLPNWTHITPTQVDRDAARRTLGWASDRFVVAHTGNMGLKQDLGTVVEAARRLPEGIDVLLIGDGNQRRALQARAAGVANLRFVDPLDDTAYPLALAAADVLLVNERPSVGDMSLPSKLTSYRSAGRPVLAAVSDGGATAVELGRTRGAGLVVRPGDPDLLARSILELRADEPLRAAMGRAGFEYAHSRLDQAASMLRLDAVVDGLLAERR